MLAANAKISVKKKVEVLRHRWRKSRFQHVTEHPKRPNVLVALDDSIRIQLRFVYPLGANNILTWFAIHKHPGGIFEQGVQFILLNLFPLRPIG